jgi:hypothetical protein
MYNTLSFRYERLQERQKDLEQKINGKISNDIHNIQEILENQARQDHKIGIVQANNNIFQKTNNEKEEQPSKNITNMYAEKNTSIADHKIKKADWYASLLMYNSY